jgi:hypothetical protein
MEAIATVPAMALAPQDIHQLMEEWRAYQMMKCAVALGASASDALSPGPRRFGTAAARLKPTRRA